MQSIAAHRAVAAVASLLAIATMCTACAVAEQPRDAAWARRQIIESQCRTWAQAQARAEYSGKSRRAAAAMQAATAPPYNSLSIPAFGLSYLNATVLQLAREGRERDLFKACMIDHGFQ
jgi:hypothetical protein